MDHYENNLYIIKEHRPFLYEQIMKKSDTSDISLIAKSVPTKTLNFALEVECQGNQIRLNSKYNPEQEAQKWAEQHQLKNLDTIIVMFGLGNGTFLRELIKKMGKDNLVIIYEPSFTIFEHVISNYSMEDILVDDRVYLSIEGKNDSEFGYFLSSALTWMNLYSQLECLHPGYDKLFPASYQNFKEMLQDNMLNNIIAKNTYGEMGKAYTENSIVNIPYIIDSVSFWDLKDKLPKDVPVIIVSAGPSLLKNVDLLKEAKGKSIIMVVDRAYETLKKHGIEPDFVIVLDAKKSIKSCGNQVGFKANLLCKLEASNKILDNHTGKKFIYDCSDYMRNMYHAMEKEMETITSGGSVTTVAFVLCVKLGLKRIVLVGSDLAYANGLSHAGMDHIPAKYSSGILELYVDDIYGNKVKTRYDWYSFLRWFESVIMQIPDFDIIDATEGGAKIKGTRIMTLREVIDQYCTTDVNIDKIINGTEDTFNIEELKAVSEYLQQGLKELDVIKEVARKTIYDCQKLYMNAKMNQENTSESKRLVSKLYEANKSIESKSIFNLVNQYVFSVAADDIEGLYFMTNDQKKDEIASYQSSEKIYASIVEGCNFLIPKLEKTLGAFNDRVEIL
jgi:hypothetical protein